MRHCHLVRWGIFIIEDAETSGKKELAILRVARKWWGWNPNPGMLDMASHTAGMEYGHWV